MDIQERDNDWFLRHTGNMDFHHTLTYIQYGCLQLPLFDTEDFDKTWNSTNDWEDSVNEMDTMRRSYGQPE